jgi:hypothetical protein
LRKVVEVVWRETKREEPTPTPTPSKEREQASSTDNQGQRQQQLAIRRPACRHTRTPWFAPHDTHTQRERERERERSHSHKSQTFSLIHLSFSPRVMELAAQDENDSCPHCGSRRYHNPNLVMYASTCGHFL